MHVILFYFLREGVLRKEETFSFDWRYKEELPHSPHPPAITSPYWPGVPVEKSCFTCCSCAHLAALKSGGWGRGREPAALERGPYAAPRNNPRRTARKESIHTFVPLRRGCWEPQHTNTPARNSAEHCGKVCSTSIRSCFRRAQSRILLGGRTRGTPLPPAFLTGGSISYAAAPSPGGSKFGHLPLGTSRVGGAVPFRSRLLPLAVDLPVKISARCSVGSLVIAFIW